MVQPVLHPTSVSIRYYADYEDIIHFKERQFKYQVFRKKIK